MNSNDLYYKLSSVEWMRPLAGGMGRGKEADRSRQAQSPIFEGKKSKIIE